MIILNLIVKDEADIIERCLDSVFDFIDAIFICDTGSSDNTIEVIRTWQKKRSIIGEVVSSPWVNFQHNRNVALKGCKQWIEKNSEEKDNYICIIDADDYLVIEDINIFEESLDDSDADLLLINSKIENINYQRPFIFNATAHSEWIGVVHEYLRVDGKVDTLKSAFIAVNRDGARNKDPLKYLKDALLLEGEMKKGKDSRNLFYLAQSYRDYGFYKLAEENYLKRFDMDEFPEERYISLIEAAKCRMKRNKNDQKTNDLLYQAFCFRPQRLEAPYYIVNTFRNKSQHFMGYIFGRSLINFPYPDDVLFVDRDIHTWKFLDEVAICACWAKDIDLFRNLSERILALDIPNEARERISKDLFTFG